MGRHKKKGFSFFTINSRTIMVIIGLLFIAASAMCFISYTNLLSSGQGDGQILHSVNADLVSKFGGLSIFIPFILLLISGLFFNTKKFKIMKLNVVIGLIMVFISLVGFFQSGDLGKSINDNLTLDFSVVGAVLILTIAFLIGIILFLDTSVDVFVIGIFKGILGTFQFIGDHLISPSNGKSKKSSKKVEDDEEDEDFIPDRVLVQPAGAKPKINPAPNLSSVPAQVKTPEKDPNDLHIRPVFQTASSTWVYPPLTLLQDINQKEAERGDVNKNADIIEKTLDSFGIRARVSEVNPGPTVTQYSLTIAIGTKLSKITSLGNDLALALAAPSGQVRIEAPIPGRSLVGIEIPNIRPQIVTIKNMLTSPVFTESTDPLLVPLGLDVGGKPQAASITKMPHVLIAGTTGSGKSVMLNAWMSTILFRTKPEEVRLILVDPKRVELTGYNGIPHLLTEVIVEPARILKALGWTVKEMENRYKQFAAAGVRNIESYNLLEGIEKKPFIVFVIDELADLMMFAPGEAEDLITRLAQMARATGIHLVLATQRPSVDVITGLMKANIPTRLAFSVSSMIDSRVIIDSPGAEKLLGKGDMLFLPPDQAKARRIQAPFITEKEVAEVVKFLKSQVPAVHYTEEITNQEMAVGPGGTVKFGADATEADQDPFFKQAIELIMQSDKASASLLQRRLKVGYARAARILDELEAAGYISPAEGSKPRDIIKRPGMANEE